MGQTSSMEMDYSLRCCSCCLHHGLMGNIKSISSLFDSNVGCIQGFEPMTLGSGYMDKATMLLVLYMQIDTTMDYIIKFLSKFLW